MAIFSADFSGIFSGARKKADNLVDIAATIILIIIKAIIRSKTNEMFGIATLARAKATTAAGMPFGAVRAINIFSFVVSFPLK